MTNHKRDEQVHRDEHNDVALAKRTLGVGFDYDKNEYKVQGVDSSGGISLSRESLIDLIDSLKMLLEEQRKTNKYLEIITGEKI